MEAGTLTELQNRWWYNHVKCDGNVKPHELSSNGLMLNNLAGLFFVLIGGLMLSLVVAIIEFCFQHCDTSKQKKLKNISATVNTFQAKSKLSIQPSREFDGARVSLPHTFAYIVSDNRIRCHESSLF